MGKFVVGVMAQVAELEAGLIGERTKGALAAAKARGARLGVQGAETLAPRYREEPKVRAEEIPPLSASCNVTAIRSTAWPSSSGAASWGSMPRSVSRLGRERNPRLRRRRHLFGLLDAAIAATVPE